MDAVGCFEDDEEEEEEEEEEEGTGEGEDLDVVLEFRTQHKPGLLPFYNAFYRANKCLI